MKRKGLCLLIAVALGGTVFAVQAQTDSGSTQGTTASSQSVWPQGYDTRWYIAPAVGQYFNDSDRDDVGNSQLYYGIGVGRFFSPNFSLDFFFDRTNRSDHGNRHWANNSYGAEGRFYAGSWDSWRPYALAGVMGSYHMNPYDHGWAPAAELGVGLSKNIGKNFDFRVEAAYRYDFDNDSISSENGYGDWRVGVALAMRLGAIPAPAPVAKAPAPTCDQLDDDGDGVNNCVDQCPNTPAGVMVGPNGCPQKVVIDLRGVNFKFDRPKKGETAIAPTLREPTAQSLAILKQAVDVLQRYPHLKVKVAGYTDSIGTDKYNQGLSERRAQIVYNYLTSHGISASRLEGPVGYGETHPIATNSTKQGRAQNRRTELQVDQSTLPAQTK